MPVINVLTGKPFPESDCEICHVDIEFMIVTTCPKCGMKYHGNKGAVTCRDRHKKRCQNQEMNK